MKNNLLKVFVSLFILLSLSCGKKSDNTVISDPGTPPPVYTNEVDFYLTKVDQSVLLQKQDGILAFKSESNAYPFIDVDESQVFQTVDGFGYTLTGGSAYVINHMSADQKASLLQELFGSGSNAISISYLRLSIGASDLNSSVFSYDDVPAGQTDTTLAGFTLDPDRGELIPLLKQILQINPSIKILATPWSAPVWMKDNGSTIGGSLLPQYYNVYAQYFVKYIQQMKAEGITIDAIAPQNEPLNPGNNPSLVMTAVQEETFIRDNLGPAFVANNMTTKIIAYDHNCDRPDYPLTILNDADARKYVYGSAFHLYGGDISALTQVHNAYPDKAVYFTEEYTASNGNFGDDLKWHLKNVVIGSMRNYSLTALEWNLANDPSYGPHTPGGCTTCKGAVTIGSSVTRNVAYYIIAHASKFVAPGSYRIQSNINGSIQTVAFKTLAGKKVLIVENDGAETSFNVRFKNKWFTSKLAAGAVATYIW